jgi:predicted nuclease of predicted toxin-antitoxin system
MDIFSLNFLADENFPLPSIKLLRANGLKVRSIIEEYPSIADVDVLNFAEKENLIILTFDKDFGELIFKKKISPPKGIFLFRLQKFSPEDPALVLLDLFRDNSINLNALINTKFFGVISDSSFRLEKFDR